MVDNSWNHHYTAQMIGSIRDTKVVNVLDFRDPVWTLWVLELGEMVRLSRKSSLESQSQDVRRTSVVSILMLVESIW